MKRAVFLILALAACVDAPSTGAAEGKLSAADRAACEAAGNRVGIAGLSGAEFCVKRATDAGKSCSKASDCEAWCDSDSRTCAAELNPFGCRSYLTEAGAVESICVD